MSDDAAMPMRLRGYALAGALFVAGALILASPWLSGHYTIPYDAKAQAWPQLAFLARTLAAGESPFWTPNVFAGWPQIADPQAMLFSPFALLALLGDHLSFWAVDAAVFALLILAGLALIAFFRDRAWHPAGALVAAFAFSFGGSAAWRIQHIGEVASLCWFAITLLLLSRAMTRGLLRYGIAAGATAALMVLGRDQIAYLCTLLLLLFVAWSLLDGEGRVLRLRRAIVPLIGGGLTGLVLIALPIALTLALAAQSNRPEIDFAGAGRGSLPPTAFLTALIANLFGIDGPLPDWWGPPLSLWGITDIFLARNMTDIYFGALPAVAILTVGILRGALLRRAILLFSVGATAMALYAVGRWTPFFALAFHLPGADLFRRPADATFPLGAMLAILAGFCVHHRLVTPDRSTLLRVVAPVLVAALWALCVFVAWDKGRLAQAAVPLGLGLALLSSGIAALLLAPKCVGRWPRGALCALTALLVLDLAMSNKPNESTALPPEHYDVLRFDTRNETLALIKARLAATAGPDRRDRVELAGVGYDWPNTGMIHGFDHDFGFNPLRLASFMQATHAPDQIATPDQRVFSPLYPRFRSPLANLLGVRLFASSVPLERVDPSFKPGDLPLLAHTAEAYVYENPDALPRVMFAGDARDANFSRMLEDGVWPPVDFTRTVLLENAPPNPPRAPGHATLTHYGNTQVVVEADAPEGGYVVLNDIWHPWWSAEVDGTPAPILRANVIFRAVAVPAGRHRVTFTFRPIAGLLAQVRAATSSTAND